MANVYSFKLISGKRQSGKTTKLVEVIVSYLTSMPKCVRDLNGLSSIGIYAHSEPLLKSLLHALLVDLTLASNRMSYETSTEYEDALKRLPCFQRGLNIGCHANRKHYLDRILNNKEGILFIDDVHDTLLVDLLSGDYPSDLEATVVGVNLAKDVESSLKFVGRVI